MCVFETGRVREEEDRVLRDNLESVGGKLSLSPEMTVVLQVQTI